MNRITPNDMAGTPLIHVKLEAPSGNRFIVPISVDLSLRKGEQISLSYTGCDPVVCWVLATAWADWHEPLENNPVWLDMSAWSHKPVGPREKIGAVK